MKALAEVVLPALPAEQRMARDQVELALGHLAILAEQWPYALRYERQSLTECLDLAAALVPALDEPALAAELLATIARAATVDVEDFAAVSSMLSDLKVVIDRAIADGAGRTPLARAVFDAVLCYNARRAPRERSWHRASGLDPDGPRLPPLQRLFDAASG